MKLTVSLEKPTVSSILTEFSEVHIGRKPIAARGLNRIEVQPPKLFAGLSRTAVVIRNDNNRIKLENHQNTGTGRVWFTEDGVFRELPAGPESGTPLPGYLTPVPRHTQVRIELFDGILRELTIHIHAEGAPLRAGGERTGSNAGESPKDPVVQDWEVAINAFRCAELAGGKLTDDAARVYYHRKVGGSTSNKRAFKAARAKAGTLLLKDAECGASRLLEVARRYIDPLLVSEMMDGAGV